MSRKLFSEEWGIVKVSDPSGAGTSTVNSTGVDMANAEEVFFCTSYGTPAADNLIHAEQSSDDGSSDTYADIAGSEPTLGGASDEDQWINIVGPEERYVRCVGVRGTSSTLGDIWAFVRKKKQAHDNTTTGTIAGVALVHPVAGTK